VDKAKMTLAAYLDLWLESVVQPNRAARTHASYSELARIHIVPALGHIKLLDLTPAHVAELMRAKEREGKSPRTVEMIRSVLVTSLGKAKKWGMIPRNVAKLTDAPKVRRQEVQSMTPEQARAFLEAVKGDRLEALYRVSLALGLRGGEALGLKWEDIDLDGETLKIRHTLQRLNGKLSSKEPKTEKSRLTLHLPAVAVHALRTHRIRQLEERLASGARWVDSGLVFTTPEEVRLMAGTCSSSTGRNCGPQDCRCSDSTICGTRRLTCCSPKGVSMFEVQNTLGHADNSTMADIYGHMLPRSRQRVAAAMNAILGDGVAV
jgi:integrase